MGWCLVLCPRHNDDSSAALWQVEVFLLELSEAVGSDQLRTEDRPLAAGSIDVIIYGGVRPECPLGEEGYKVSSFLEED